jgi:hypothetical protein
MHTHTFKNGVKLCFVFTLFLLQASILPAFSIPAPIANISINSDSELTVTPTSSSSAQLDWAQWGGQGAYTVRVKLSGSGTVLRQFNTNNNTTSIDGLVKGEGYRFEVEKNGLVIVIDVEVFW